MSEIAPPADTVESSDEAAPETLEVSEVDASEVDEPEVEASEVEASEVEVPEESLSVVEDAADAEAEVAEH